MGAEIKIIITFIALTFFTLFSLIFADYCVKKEAIKNHLIECTIEHTAQTRWTTPENCGVK